MRHAALTPDAATARCGHRAHDAEAGLRVGGLTPFTSIDFPGRLSAVVFVQGCPLRCGYCHNPHLQRRAGDAAPSWPQTRDWLRRRAGLLDAVVFSGGEPTVDPMLGAAMAEARAMGFGVGLHTAGTHPRRLREVVHLADWVGLDVKAPLRDAELYDRITGRRGSARRASASLDIVLRWAKDYELRTTVDWSWLDDAALRRLGDDLAERGARNFALQMARRQGHPAPLADPRDPAPSTVDALRRQFAGFTLRRDPSAALGRPDTPSGAS